MTQRRLTAIMFTDIVGYTALMGSNEKTALELLEKNISIHKSLIEKYNGTLLKLIGDGTLICFGSSSDAVLCAQAIVKATKDIPKLTLRIGIHEGEVIFKDNDVIGDGVNIASRISDLAKSDMILISENIFQNIKNKEELKAVYYTKKQLKNVDHPLIIYEMVEEGNYQKSIYRTIRSNSRHINKFTTITIIVFLLLIVGYFSIRYLRDREETGISVDREQPPTIAVLPLLSLSDDPEQAYFCLGLADEMINQLQKIGGLVVRSRTSSFKYKEHNKTIPEIASELDVEFILEGSVLKAGDSIQIIIQLINGHTDEHIWAETYREKYDDIFSIMSSIPRLVANSFHAEITPEIELQIDRIPTVNLAAYDTYLKGIASLSEYYYSLDEKDYHQAVDYFQSCISLDDIFAAAYAYLAQTHRYYLRFGKGSMLGQDTPLIDSIINICNKAIELDPDQALAYANMGDIYDNLRVDKDKAEKAFQKVMELNPNDVETLWPLGLNYRAKGDYTGALQFFSRWKNPAYRQYLPYTYCVTGNILLTMGDVGKAEKVFQESLIIKSDFIGGYADLAKLELVKGNYEKCLSHRFKIDSLIPNQWWNIAGIIRAYILLNDYEKADHYLSTTLESVKDNPNYEFIYSSLSNLHAYILWNTGKKEQAVELLEADIKAKENRLKDAIPYDNQFGFWMSLARNHALLGNKDDVYRVLYEFEKRGITHSLDLYFQHDPVFGIIWGEKEFDDFLKRVAEKKKVYMEEAQQLREEGVI